MKVEQSIRDIWDAHAKYGGRVVVSTNIGWTEDWSGENAVNNMGAGLALQAASRWPELPHWLGTMYRSLGAHAPVLPHPDLPLLFAPVKELQDDPSDSPFHRATYARVATSIAQLRAMVDVRGPILVTLIGAGNGGLDPSIVFRTMRSVLSDRFVLVDPKLPKVEEP